jgi:NAD(P)-dependent dehydrogenase (short-subunit alcohol dehydrogenase family)
MNRFEGKIAVVTGGSGGIGSAICQRLSDEGAHVVICDLNAEASEELAKNLGNASVETVDISHSQSARDMIERVVTTHGKLDVLCNNAGINRRGALMDLSEDDWHSTFAVNLTAMFHLCQASIPHMITGGGGAIVNTASQWGLHPAPAHIAYNTSKAAVAAFTQNLGRDYAPDKIRVNAVCPGEVKTSMLASGLARTGRTFEDLDKLIPYGRIGKPEEIAALVAFLASEEAAFMCGSLVEITGAQAVA